MIRARVAVEAQQATAVNCEDARHGLPALVGGPIGLTDWALLEAHLKHCADCRQAEAHLRQRAAASQPVTWPDAVLASFWKAMELARIGATCSTARLGRRRALLTAAARDLTPRATVGVMRAVGLAVGYSADLTARIRPSLATVHDVIADVAPRRASLAISLRSSVTTVGGVVLALALTLSALLRTDGPEQLAGPRASPGPGPGPTRLEPAQVEPTQLAPSLFGAIRREEDRIGRATADRRATTISVRGTASSGPTLTA